MSPSGIASSSIFALGVAAYWLLTGELVFTADTAIGVLLPAPRSPAEMAPLVMVTGMNTPYKSLADAVNAAKAKPGLQGNLILNVFAERPGTKGGKAGKQAQRSSLGTMQ